MPIPKELFHPCDFEHKQGWIHPAIVPNFPYRILANWLITGNPFFINACVSKRSPPLNKLSDIIPQCGVWLEVSRRRNLSTLLPSLVDRLEKLLLSKLMNIKTKLLHCRIAKLEPLVHFRRRQNECMTIERTHCQSLLTNDFVDADRERLTHSTSSAFAERSIFHLPADLFVAIATHMFAHVPVADLLIPRSLRQLGYFLFWQRHCH